MRHVTHAFIIFLLFQIQKATQSCQKRHERPNIIVIIGDDMGHNDFGFRGSNQIPTPNIDSLGYHGIILDKYYVQNACTPSRAAFLTGNYPLRSRMQGVPIIAGQNKSLPLDITIMPQHFKKLGYKTHIVGKWHLGSNYRACTPTQRGFDSHLGYWSGFLGYFDYFINFNATNIEGFDLHDGFKPGWDYFNQYATTVFTDRALQIIDDHNSKKPLFLMVSHLAAHAGRDGIELGVPNVTETNQKYDYIQNPRRRLYADIVNLVDQSVGQIVQKLLERNMLENSIVLFFSDNGAPTELDYGNSGSNWPLRGMKMTNFEGGVRGSGVIFSPLLQKRSYVSSELIHVTDWLPTLYSAAGGDVADLGSIDGVNQWDTLSTQAPSARSEILININEVENTTSIITENGKYKLMTGTADGGGTKDAYFGESGRDPSVPPYDFSTLMNCPTSSAIRQFTNTSLTEQQITSMREEVDLSWCREPDYTPFLNCTNGCLFDLENDPCETTNIIEDEPEITKGMLDRIEYFYQFLLPQVTSGVDAISNPQLYNNTWCTWLDNSWCLKTLNNTKLI